MVSPGGGFRRRRERHAKRAIEDGGVAWLGSTLTGPGVLYFSWKVSSEEGYDFLEFLLDNQLYDYISGEVDWQGVSFLIPPGVHDIDWVYFKDEVLRNGSDAGWLDEVVFVPLDPYSYWKNLFFSPDELLEEEISGLHADPDFDGIINALEYAFGLYPFEFDESGKPRAEAETGPQGKSLVLVYTRRNDDPNVHYRLEKLDNAGSWIATNPPDWAEVFTPIYDNVEEVRARYTLPFLESAEGFFRVRVEFEP